MKEKIATSYDLISTEELNDLIVEAIQDVKGSNIVRLDMQQIKDAPAEYFIICDAESTVKCKAIANRIKENIKETANIKPNHIEGLTNGQWVLVDYLSTIVHVFYRETRSYYDLEELWQDAKITEFENL